MAKPGRTVKTRRARPAVHQKVSAATPVQLAAKLTGSAKFRTSAGRTTSGGSGRRSSSY